jgi:cytochrome c
MRLTQTHGSRLPFAAVILALLTSAGCDDATKRSAAAMTGGDPDRGGRLIQFYGCGSCHEIPGIRGADGLVGPPLARIAERSYVGGVIKNRPENMIRWIQNPPGIDPLTAMPNLHVTPADAQDIAGYLYTLR